MGRNDRIRPDPVACLPRALASTKHRTSREELRPIVVKRLDYARPESKRLDYARSMALAVFAWQARTLAQII